MPSCSPPLREAEAFSSEIIPIGKETEGHDMKCEFSLQEGLPDLPVITEQPWNTQGPAAWGGGEGKGEGYGFSIR